MSGLDAADSFFAIFGMSRKEESMDKTDILYADLRSHLDAAYIQASAGKGKERHAQDGQPFGNQQICILNKEIGTNHGCIYQAAKKTIESVKILKLHGKEAAKAELYGAINYLAAACILIDEME